MAFTDVAIGLSESLPIESVTFLIQAVGGLAVIYVIYAVVRFILERKRNKMIDEMRKDIKLIKKKFEVKPEKKKNKR